MRSSKDMMDLILNTAKEDERILAVYMNGSRANPNAPIDIFQDYDIVYVVTEVKPFFDDSHWIERFGEILLIEEPDYLDAILGETLDFSQRYAWLIQFSDGNRIDLTLQTLEVMHKEYGKDSMTIPLWDRGSYLPPIPPTSDQDYWIQPPTEEIFFARCNDFYWVLPYVAKGLWRNELLYALDCFQYLRPKLVTMLNWKVGLVHGWEISTGKAGKYLPRYLSAEMMQRVYATYPTGNTEGIWQALFTMETLVHEIALEVASAYGYWFDTIQRESSVNFVEHIRNLPKDASKIM
jgi:aminoglycoside 6-adenylyltransferase